MKFFPVESILMSTNPAGFRAAIIEIDRKKLGANGTSRNRST
jgi:hypothetical protein